MVEDDLIRFSKIRHSYISSHQTLCCQLARLQVLAQVDDVSLPSALAALPQQLKWSPNPWPLRWCDITAAEKPGGDCGVHAAIARELMERHEVFPSDAQIAIRDFGWSAPHWRDTWETAGIKPDWVGDEVVYHEVLFLQGRFWDPSEARWIDGVGSTLGCGVVAATRIGLGEWKVAP